MVAYGQNKSENEANSEVEQQNTKGVHFLDYILISKLENNIENMQKDRDSVFNLDEEFYNKLLFLNNHKVNYPERRVSTNFEHVNDTVDDYK